MSKTKYLALLAVVVLGLSIFSGIGINIGGKMHPPDGELHQVHQTTVPPIINGIVEVPTTWPANSFIGYMWITGKPASTPVAEVYMLFGWLEDPDNLYTEPISYDAVDWTGFYLYIGIKALDGYTIEADGNEVLIDWNQDGTVDFADHNGQSTNQGNGEYPTIYGHTDSGTEWAVPYFDEFNGICQSPFDIYLHVDVSGEGYNAETSTFPNRPPGHKLSTTICPWELISPEPPEPNGWGLRTIGFWKHQFRTALGVNKGHQHVDTATLHAYITHISAYSEVTELQDMGSDMWAALAILESKGPSSMYEKAVQQLLATWLNFVSDGDQMVDTTGDGNTDMMLSNAIAYVEDILTDPNSTHEDYEEAKDICDTINNSGPE